MATSKKHHYIPQFILRNFADAGEKISFKRHGTSEWRSVSPGTVGYRNNAHRVSARLNEDPSFYEKQMSLVESESAPLIQELAASNVSLVPEAMKAALQRFMIMNQMREPGLLEGILPDVQAKYSNFMHLPGVEELTQDLGVAAMSWPAPGSENDPAVPSYEGRSEAYAEVFGAFRWNVVRFAGDSLVLGDRLVCTYGQSEHATGERGLSASRFGGEGLLTCDRVTVPLTPRVGLLLSRPGRPETLNPIAFNRTTILNSRSFVARHPLWPSTASAAVDSAAIEHIRQVEKMRGFRAGPTR